jgi:hypothetical protein
MARFFVLLIVTATLTLFATCSGVSAQDEEKGQEGFGWSAEQWQKFKDREHVAPPQSAVEPVKKQRKYKRPKHPRCYDSPDGKTHCRW